MSESTEGLEPQQVDILLHILALLEREGFVVVAWSANEADIPITFTVVDPAISAGVTLGVTTIRKAKSS